MKLLIISHVLVRCYEGRFYLHGGFGRVVDAFARRCRRIDLLTCMQAEAAKPDDYRLRAENVHIIPLPPLRRGSRLSRYLSMVQAAAVAALKLPAAIRAADVVHPRLPSVVGTVGAVAERLSRRPAFYYIAGDWEVALRSRGSGLPTRLLASVVGWALRAMVRGRLCFTAGDAVARRFATGHSAVVPLMTTVIDREHIVDAESAAKRALRTPRELLFVGSVWKMKGIQVLIQALAILRKRGIPARLRVVGAMADDGKWFWDLMRSEGVGELVAYEPHMDWDRLIKTYELSDIFVLPSLEGRGEGVPKVALEAMARGVPVIASSVGGLSSLISHGHNGLLVPPNSPEAIADAVVELWFQPNIRQRIVEGGVATAKGFELESVVEWMFLCLNEHGVGPLPAPATRMVEA